MAASWISCYVLMFCASASQLPKAKELFDTASGILGYDLLEKCKTGPKNVLDSTVRKDAQKKKEHADIDSKSSLQAFCCL